MLLRLVGVGKLSGGLDDDLSSDGFPGQDGGIFLLENLNDFAVDGNAVRAGSDLVRQIAEDRVVLEQVSQRLGSVRSLTATKSIFLSVSAVRRTLRPMRPNPLMPTFTAMVPPKGNFNCPKICSSFKQHSMVTGSSSQRKCHGGGGQLPQLEHYSTQRAASTAAEVNSCERDLYVRVGVAPQEGDTGEPIFCFDRLADASALFRWQDADPREKFGASDFPAHGAGSDLDLRVIAYALAFSQLAVGHEVELIVVFGKPDGV